MKKLCKNKHWKLNEDYDINKILYLFIDRPNDIDSFEGFIWKNNKGWHRDYNLPAYINYNGGYVAWYKNNNLYRENNKPTIIWGDG